LRQANDEQQHIQGQSQITNMQEEFDDVFEMTLEEAMNLGHIIYALRVM